MRTDAQHDETGACGRWLSASGRAGVAGRPPHHRLDLEGNNSESARCELLAVPKWSGGRLDPIGGRGKRIHDLKRIEALESSIRKPAMLTLTIDRKRFAGPEKAYEYAMPKVSELLRFLGAKKWVRVVEVQTKSGDGWIHWHVLIDLAEVGGLTAARRRCWHLWRDKWGIGGCDLDAIRKSAAGYLAKYVTKAWPAVPHWMGASCKRFRLVGFSKLAGQIIRRKMDLPPPRPVAEARHRRKRYRKTRPLFERLASSGMTTGLIYRDADGRSKYLATVPIYWDVLDAVSDALGLPLEWEGRGSMLAAAMDERKAKAVVQRLERVKNNRFDQDYAYRLKAWRHSWDRLEYEREQKHRAEQVDARVS